MHLVDVYLIDEDRSIKAEMGTIPSVATGDYVVVGGIATYQIVAVCDTETLVRQQKKDYGNGDCYLIGKVV